MFSFQLKQKTDITKRVDYERFECKIKFKYWLKDNLKTRFKIAIEFEDINAITITYTKLHIVFSM